MRFLQSLITTATYLSTSIATFHTTGNGPQSPLLRHGNSNRTVSAILFAELEELARIVDISYCVGLTGLGIIKPFQCLSRCSDFPSFELVTTWLTGPLLSDSCGYIALDHGKQRIIVAFRGTYSIASTVVDLSTVPQEYVPYPGSDDEKDEGAVSEDVSKETLHGIDGHTKRGVIAVEDKQIKCENCTVHMGFHTAWLHTRKRILADLNVQTLLHPDYELNLVGHSSGGVVAALAALDFQGRGWDPIVTTFGEPRMGNKGLVKFVDDRFKLDETQDDDTKMKYRRVTHIDDPVPLLPLTEWGYAMHAGEIYISKPSLSPDIRDLEHCAGDSDQECIAGHDATAAEEDGALSVRKRDLLSSVRDEIHDVVNEPWGISVEVQALAALLRAPRLLLEAGVVCSWR